MTTEIFKKGIGGLVNIIEFTDANFDTTGIPYMAGYYLDPYYNWQIIPPGHFVLNNSYDSTKTFRTYLSTPIWAYEIVLWYEAGKSVPNVTNFNLYYNPSAYAGNTFVMPNMNSNSFTVNYKTYIASASSEYGMPYDASFKAYHAFNTSSDIWASAYLTYDASGNPVNSPSWLELDLPNEIILRQVRIVPEAAHMDRSPLHFKFYMFKNNVWTLLIEQSYTISSWLNDDGSYGKTFDIPANLQYLASKYRLEIDSVNGSQIASISYLTLLSDTVVYPVVSAAPISIIPYMTSNTAPSGFVASASSVFTLNDGSKPYPAYFAFNNSTDSWVSNYDTFDSSGNGNQWIEIDVPYALSPNYSVFAINIIPEAADMDRSPNSFSFQAYVNGAWKVLVSNSDWIQSYWNTTSNVFPLAIFNTLATKYRLVITKVNGSTVTSITTLKLLTYYSI